MIVYFHRNPQTYEIFYVGIASEKGRAQRPWKTDNRNKYWHHYVNKYGGFVVQIVCNNLSIELAREKEVFYISLLGRKIDGGQLVNIAFGGETNAGYKQTDKQRKESSDRMIRRGNGHMMTKESRAKAVIKISKSLTGRLVGDKNPNYGNRWTSEMKLYMSELKKNYYKNNPKEKKIIIKKDPIISRRNIYNAMVEAHGRKVICKNTGIVYKTIVDAAKSINMHKDELRHKLHGKSTNNTTLIFLPG